MEHTLKKLQKGDYLYRGYRITQCEFNGYNSTKQWETSKYKYGYCDEYEHLSYTLGDAQEMINEHIRYAGHLMTNEELRKESITQAQEK